MEKHNAFSIPVLWMNSDPQTHQQKCTLKRRAQSSILAKTVISPTSERSGRWEQRDHWLKGSAVYAFLQVSSSGRFRSLGRTRSSRKALHQTLWACRLTIPALEKARACLALPLLICHLVIGSHRRGLNSVPRHHPSPQIQVYLESQDVNLV